jgi:opacity protein-like surface antigen
MRPRLLRFLALPLLCVLALAGGAAAQANPPVAPNLPPPNQPEPSPYGGNWEIFAGAGMQFAKATTANGQPLSTTNIVSGQVGLRYHISDFNALELRYTFAQPTQTYGSNLYVKSRASEFSAAYVWTYPASGPIRPFVLGGVGFTDYTPVASQSTPGAVSERKWELVYGGGLDVVLAKQWTVRVEYRGHFYRIPDFGLIPITQFNHMAEPDIELVYHF